ncbi:hypothetical protein HUO13_12120 [Saccharopolyspora erythraea]|uniref:VG15 protein n=1 Tax=Saccharopolyspora erythraea TaxID=1836 RepID=UPI001BA91A23|nr:hypothetical protein [Saccharopolyspora erythraea]QUH01459.1 hypothetical protein HUO13_12120 [Saccharopolyspora erythraea]
MSLSSFYSAQRAILGPLIDAALRLLGLSAGKPLSPQQRRDLVTILTESANGARDKASALAFELYEELRPSDADPFGRPPVINPMPERYFEKVLSTYLDDLESEDNNRAAVTRITQAAASTVENASRETIQAATRIDPVAVRWARVLTGVESCGFCAMLAARGADYRTETSAGGNNDWHPGCDCLVVPVFRGHETEWPGYAESQKLAQFWADKTSGHRGKDALREFKRVFASEDPTSYSPITTEGTAR